MGSWKSRKKQDNKQTNTTSQQIQPETTQLKGRETNVPRRPSSKKRWTGFLLRQCIATRLLMIKLRNIAAKLVCCFWTSGCKSCHTKWGFQLRPETPRTNFPQEFEISKTTSSMYYNVLDQKMFSWNNNNNKDNVGGSLFRTISSLRVPAIFWTIERKHSICEIEINWKNIRNYCIGK